MDNSQFRTLLQSGKPPSDSDPQSAPAGFKKPALGSRSRASIPMTPRSVAGYNPSREFSKQVADHERARDGQPPAKKFKSSAAPKGTRLAAGYHDRTLARRTGEEGEETSDDREKRLQALEEMYKLQQIDEATFEKLKDEIGIGGSLNSTHLVKGLDWKLLERVRKGEDLENNSEEKRETSPRASKVDVDEELDQVLEKQVESRGPAPRQEQEAEDDGTTGDHRPLTRDEILQRLKQSRSGAPKPPAPEPVLSDRFKKVGSEKKSNKMKFVEIVNGRRREVLVITNKDGTTKRKTRWLDKEDERTVQGNRPLGMEVPAELLAKQQAALEQEAAGEDDDDDIFQGVADYDPLAGLEEDSDEEGKADETGALKPEAAVTDDKHKPRNYFGSSRQEEDAENKINPILKDPTLLAALKRAAGLKRSEQDAGLDPSDADPERAAKQQQLLARLKAQERADAEDMDLGFGDSRFGDDDDDEGPIWDDAEGASKKSGRKRGPKKRKGDKDNVGDVMAALEGRKKDKAKPA
ncbi:hypothetical protein PV08_07311 [Exophiala spinifera]|uniref:RED-like N-terminal domain-containing protein n=1 Tax=Exophiala spinifera TaxID=91928 RepID=A0A0D1ZP27_9EURO|nr:uncharacterized protein PV08_07311 [Exophiala spinifera]KIW14527.1 hypothetical protein PV08_07311 [Exophiala spinifera]